MFLIEDHGDLDGSGGVVMSVLPKRAVLDFHWPRVDDMLGQHVEIIRLYSDEDQAGLFAGILSTL